jgi:hypothetical protein
VWGRHRTVLCQRRREAGARREAQPETAGQHVEHVLV